MTENEAFLSEQIITYIGNKRGLLGSIEAEVIDIARRLQKKQMACVDLFSGSGIVARCLKRYASELYVNDLEEYSRVINECYLCNVNEFPRAEYEYHYEKICGSLSNLISDGLIYTHYAPRDDARIMHGERVFYTTRNAQIIDTLRRAIDSVPASLQMFYLAPLLYAASVHVNTGGVFKGFYKDSKTGIGKFGGNGGHALSRIQKEITLYKPPLSNFECPVHVLTEEALQAARRIRHADLVYIDPPYNQHPYGSNYFMLNIIVKNKIETKLSAVSGIPPDWNRSDYNKRRKALAAFDVLMAALDTKYAIVSYNEEGFISLADMERLLRRYGTVRVKALPYTTYRASRNLNGRSIRVTEYIFVLKKN